MPESTINTINKGTSPQQHTEGTQKILFFNYHEASTENYSLPGQNEDIHDNSLIITHFPNHYVPSYCEEYTRTRIVRIPRVFTTEGLPYPEFSSVLPGREEAAITDDQQTFVPRGVINGQWYGMNSFSPLSLYLGDSEFKEIIDDVNKLLKESYETSVWDIVWFLLDMSCLWLLSQFVTPRDKRKLDQLEHTIIEYNKKIENKGIKIISPRRSAYLSLDFQVPKPEYNRDE